ncbi:MAG: hypothetical protein WC847_00125 [Candidatus Paceibacterota bacterium]|jgi:hypothetical protein
MANKEISKLLISLVIILLLGIALYILTQKQKHQQYIPNAEISQLDNIYSNNLNQKSNYSFRVISIDSEATEGAELRVFFDKNNGNTKILEASYGGETYMTEYSYYFEDANNFLLIEKTQQWDRPYSEKGRQETKNEINKYYFSNLEMIGWTGIDNKTFDPVLPEFKQKQQVILRQLEKFFKEVSK